MLPCLYIVGDATVLDMVLDGLAWPEILHDGLGCDPNILGKFIILSGPVSRNRSNRPLRGARMWFVVSVMSP